MSNFPIEQLNADDVNGGNNYINGIDGIDATALNKIVGAILFLQSNGGTIVTQKDENGNVVELKTFDADTKVNSITDNPGYRYIYAQSPSGVDSKLIVATSPPLIENIRIPQYWINTDTIANTEPPGKGVLVTSTPTQDFHCANKKYVDDTVKIYRHNIHCGNGGTQVWFTIDSKTIDTAFGNAELFALWLSEGNTNKLPKFFVCRNTQDATYSHNGELYLNGTHLSIQQEEQPDGTTAIVMGFRYSYSQQVSGVPITADMCGTFVDSVIEL